MWVVIVAVVAAAVWWLVPQGTSPSQEPDPQEPAATAPARPAPIEAPPPDVTADEEATQALDDDASPTAAPLPRDQVELPADVGATDAGVRDDAPVDVAARRDAMLGTVLDRLREDLQAAEEAGDAEAEARIRVRIERLEARRQELAEP